MRCRTCFCTVPAELDTCDACGSPARVHGPDDIADDVLYGAMDRAIADVQMGNPDAVPTLLDRLSVIAGRIPAAAKKLASLDGAGLPPSTVLAFAYHAARAGDAALAGRWCQALPDVARLNTEPRLTAQRDGDTVTIEAVAGDVPIGAVIAGPEGAVLEAGLPPLRVGDFEAFRRTLEDEAAAARLMSLALAPAEAGVTTENLDPWVRERWGDFRQDLHASADGLPAPEAETELSRRAAARDGKYFKSLEAAQLLGTLEEQATAPIAQAAASLVATHQSRVAADLVARLRARLRAAGLASLAAAGDELRRAITAMRNETKRMRDQQERMCGRSREALSETLQELKRKAGSLGWSLSRAFELGDVSEQAGVVVARSREAEILKHGEAFVEVLDSRSEEELRALLEPTRAREARVASLRRGAERTIRDLHPWDSETAARVAARVDALREGCRDDVWTWIEQAVEADVLEAAVRGFQRSPARRS